VVIDDLYQYNFIYNPGGIIVDNPSIRKNFYFIGNFNGKVKDAHGQAIADAVIKTNLSSSLSSADGSYLLSHPSGTYTVTAVAEGYRPKSFYGVFLGPSEQKTLDFTLIRELRLDAVYPTLGMLGKDLNVTLMGDGFDENTRIQILSKIKYIYRPPFPPYPIIIYDPVELKEIRVLNSDRLVKSRLYNRLK
jgi:hypothetical protein